MLVLTESFGLNANEQKYKYLCAAKSSMLTLPASMDNLVYFTKRTIGSSGHIVAWAQKQACPTCKKAIMGKPTDAKGKVKIRAAEYTCPACGYTAEKEAYEDTLTCNIIYTCPHCNAHGEATVLFQRKKIKVFDGEKGKDVAGNAIRFVCAACKKNIDIMKKMKA